MARIEWVEQRLNNWAMWKLRGGTMLGYAAANLERAGGALDPWASAPVPILDVEASETDAAVDKLPSDLKYTVTTYYIGKGGLRDKLALLCCSKPTLMERINRAHRLLADHWHAQKKRQDDERARVALLQVSRR